MTSTISMYSTPSPWEMEIVREWRPICRILSYRVFHVEVLGLDREDVEAMLEVRAVSACRSWARKHDSKPPRAWIRCVLNRGLSRTIEQVVSQIRSGGSYYDPGSTVTEGAEETAPSAERQFAEQETRDAYAGLVHALQRDLPPAAFALLYLRYLAEREPLEIVEMTGIQREKDSKPGNEVNRRLYAAKVRARELFASAGIYLMEDIDDAAE